MNQRTQTILAVAVAVVAVLLAFMTRSTPFVDARSTDIGQPLTPGLDSFSDIRSLEVIAYDTDAASHRAIKIEFDGERWVITSASGYPADATKRIADAVAALVGLTKESVASEHQIDHAALRLINPTDESGDPDGRGVRVTIRDTTGKASADLIIGKPIGTGGDTSNRFVRLASEDRAMTTTFLTDLDAVLSTDLTDWINTDPLRVAPDDVQWIRIDAYTVDEEKGRRIDGPRTELQTSDDDPSRWVLAPTGEQSDERAVTDLINSIAAMRIIGVEPKPSKLASLLAGEASEAAFEASDLRRMQRTGFFLTPEGRLLANAGELRFKTNTGLEYTLWFGEIQRKQTAGTTPDARAMLITVGAIDPENEQAVEVANERTRAFANWWYLIDDADFVRLRASGSSLQTSISDEQP